MILSGEWFVLLSYFIWEGENTRHFSGEMNRYREYTYSGDNHESNSWSRICIFNLVSYCMMREVQI